MENDNNFRHVFPKISISFLSIILFFYLYTLLKENQLFLVFYTYGLGEISIIFFVYTINLLLYYPYLSKFNLNIRKIMLFSIIFKFLMVFIFNYVQYSGDILRIYMYDVYNIFIGNASQIQYKYPPFATLYFIFNFFIHGFGVGYRIENILWDLGIIYLMYKIGVKEKINNPKFRIGLLLYGLLPFTLVWNVLLGQFDIFFIFLTILAIYLFISEKIVLSGIIFALSIMTKIFSLVIVTSIIFLLQQRKEYKKIGKFLISGIITILILFIPFYLLVGWDGVHFTFLWWYDQVDYTRLPYTTLFRFIDNSIKLPISLGGGYRHLSLSINENISIPITIPENIGFPFSIIACIVFLKLYCIKNKNLNSHNLLKILLISFLFQSYIVPYYISWAIPCLFLQRELKKEEYLTLGGISFFIFSLPILTIFLIQNMKYNLITLYISHIFSLFTNTINLNISSIFSFFLNVFSSPEIVFYQMVFFQSVLFGSIIVYLIIKAMKKNKKINSISIKDYIESMVIQKISERDIIPLPKVI